MNSVARPLTRSATRKSAYPSGVLVCLQDVFRTHANTQTQARIRMTSALTVMERSRIPSATLSPSSLLFLLHASRYLNDFLIADISHLIWTDRKFASSLALITLLRRRTSRPALTRSGSNLAATWTDIVRLTTTSLTSWTAAFVRSSTLA